MVVLTATLALALFFSDDILFMVFFLFLARRRTPPPIGHWPFSFCASAIVSFGVFFLNFFACFLVVAVSASDRPSWACAQSALSPQTRRFFGWRARGRPRDGGKRRIAWRSRSAVVGGGPTRASWCGQGEATTLHHDPPPRD
nr:hypothetical protein [Pandoravirus belohorizontensis]